MYMLRKSMNNGFNLVYANLEIIHLKSIRNYVF